MLASTLVLNFHGLGEPPAGLDAAALRYFVTEKVFTDTIHMLNAAERASGRRVRITFDDGNASDITLALPQLIDAGRSATFFVLAGRIGTPGYLCGADLREMEAAGMSIGSHGWNHVDWTRTSGASRHHELRDARSRIEDEIGGRVTEAAPPFGRFDKPLLRDLKREGYERVYSTVHGLSYDRSWFCPRWSATDTFNPQTDLMPALSLPKALRDTAKAFARHLRYRI